MCDHMWRWNERSKWLDNDFLRRVSRAVLPLYKGGARYPFWQLCFQSTALCFLFKFNLFIEISTETPARPLMMLMLLMLKKKKKTNLKKHRCYFAKVFIWLLVWSTQSDGVICLLPRQYGHDKFFVLFFQRSEVQHVTGSNQLTMSMKLQ